MGSNHEKNWRSKISWHTPFKMGNVGKKTDSFSPKIFVDDLPPGGDNWAADGQSGSGAVGDVLSYRLPHHLAP